MAQLLPVNPYARSTKADAELSGPVFERDEKGREGYLGDALAAGSLREVAECWPRRIGCTVQRPHLRDVSVERGDAPEELGTAAYPESTELLVSGCFFGLTSWFPGEDGVGQQSLKPLVRLRGVSDLHQRTALRVVDDRTRDPPWPPIVLVLEVPRVLPPPLGNRLIYRLTVELRTSSAEPLQFGSDEHEGRIAAIDVRNQVFGTRAQP
jgi:hypothetical protein